MTELTSIKGIGEKTAEALGRLGIFSAESLLCYYPRDYETFEAPKKLYELSPGSMAAVEGILQKEAAMNRFNGMVIVNAYLSDMTGRLQLSWYNLPYIRQSLKPGVHYVFVGRIYEKNGRLLMSQPKVYGYEDYMERYMGRLLPIYPLTKGVSNRLLVKAVGEALSMGISEKEYMPKALLKANSLPELSEAQREIHFPKTKDGLLLARRRISFDEFFFFLLTAAKLKEEQEKQQSAYRCKPDFRMIRFIADLPFELTKAQQEAYRAIMKDMGSGRVMNRLIEGDVGSGKTIVAVLAMMQAALNGYQAAMMAPTEVLARQHYENIKELFEGCGVTLTPLLLTGSMTAAEKRRAYEAVLMHEADIVIGTHALIQDKLQFQKLGLVVTDEQHRFGVGQRDAFKEKGNLPHTLVMSATPIPRTLAIILYGELDISVIDVLPSGRKPVKNCVVGTDYRRKAYKFIYDEIEKGHQAYVICPAIEAEKAEEEGAGGTSLAASEALENVLDYTEKLRKLFPEKIRIGALHGRMKAEEKDRIMQAFKEREIDLLVSTTVVEVGVDVPNATVMMIENAERFGLAQLHQLRGRVGRGDAQSYCIMLNTSEGERAKERLDILNHSNDGFEIAAEDLKLRGPGDIFGIRQSGELSFHIADIYNDAALLKAAKEAVAKLLEEDAALRLPEHAGIEKKLREALQKTYVV